MAQVHRDFRPLASYDLITQYPLGMSFGIQLGANAWGGGSGADVYTGMLTLRGWHDATGGGYTSWQLLRMLKKHMCSMKNLPRNQMNIFI